MTCTTPSLLTRLRRHRGLWALAMAVLLIKLVSSSVCIGDDPAAQLTATQTATSVLVAMDSAATGASGGAVCLLGETGGCHCACAHALTLIARAALAVTPLDAGIESSRRSQDFVPDTTGSLLRPPIA